nr:NnrU family protein [Kiloniellales bacterium]
MLQGLDDLLAATLVFVAGHFLLSSQVLRQPLASRLGEPGFLGLYSLIAFAALLWMIFAYGAAPVITLWEPPVALRWVPLILMPFALFLAVAGLTAPNPTMVGGERVVDGGPEDQTPGIVRITRHPFLWGVTLWAIGHLAVRGDGAS